MHTADGVGVEQVAQRRIVVALAARAARAAERDHRRRGQAQLAGGASEELDVLRVRARPAALDVVHAEVVELLGDAQLVVDRGRHALDLQAVAQGGVEDLDEVHRTHPQVRSAFPVLGRSESSKISASLAVCTTCGRTVDERSDVLGIWRKGSGITL